MSSVVEVAIRKQEPMLVEIVERTEPLQRLELLRDPRLALSYECDVIAFEIPEYVNRSQFEPLRRRRDRPRCVPIRIAIAIEQSQLPRHVIER